MNLRYWDQGQWMTLTFGTLRASCTHLVDCIYQLWYHRLQKFLKTHCFTFFPYKTIMDQIWHGRKTGQGQPIGIIWINFVVLEYPVLHTNFQSHRPFGSREEDFVRMDRWVKVLRPFNSISVILRQWKGEHERLCAMKRRLGSGRISPPTGFEPATPWSEVGSTNHSATIS